MAHNNIDTITNKKNEAAEPGVKTEEKEGTSVNMVTIERTKAENFLLVLEECIGDIEEQKNLVDTLIKTKNAELQGFQSETIEKFNALIEVTSDLKDKIEATDSYENYLQEQIKNANLSKEVAMLEQQLQKEKAEITSFIIKADNFITMKIGELTETVNNLKTVDTAIDQNIQKFKEELQAEARKYNSSADTVINEASESLINGAKVQFENLKAECNSMLKSYTEKCQQHLDTVKKQSIDFLKQCESENKKLIEKVPAVADKKISKKDILIFVLSALAIISVLGQLYIK